MWHASLFGSGRGNAAKPQVPQRTCCRSNIKPTNMMAPSSIHTVQYTLSNNASYSSNFVTRCYVRRSRSLGVSQTASVDIYRTFTELLRSAPGQKTGKSSTVWKHASSSTSFCAHFIDVVPESKNIEVNGQLSGKFLVHISSKVYEDDEGISLDLLLW
jgi:hypothetical protein